ncbi:phosphorylase b kinase gamma catalytic chain, skeletal muscle/heart isoform isoform X2 [Lingula anatina]|uniref:phosphorylase kinase n=1 Tax=Lingula anatina TaxID=7574 RepID=A0A1S3HSR1_LINAN|nr:phosphorylase b kinase gamma catalytic chain, skeletal muscle/heart isoform isoform X2 [Lingula anatina]|eukprot:XP_013388094.1 phosphorylase b kinase gamma catalytic chain, skeletal muscle/heart isoform isoform X2 [Lingula anatina]
MKSFKQRLVEQLENTMCYACGKVESTGVSSTVRRVKEKSTGREFAAKIIDISCEKSTDHQAEELKSATKKEINILRMCAGHPHIIELHDVFESPTFIFLVFEICKKGELFDYLNQVVTLSEKRTRIVMKQLLDAVEFIHDKNIVHRDLKPENILLDDNMNVKLSDFGFATVVSNDNELFDLCGTPGYLAPEVLKVSMFEDVSGYGKPADMWACGVIMYTLLVGCPPFWHRKQMYMLRAIMDGNYKFSSPEWDDISEVAKDLVSRMLVTDPKQRLSATQSLAHNFFTDDNANQEISKLLVVDPSNRLTSKEVLAHEFFSRTILEKKTFYPLRVFRAAGMAVKALIRLKRLRTHPPPINLETVCNDPYAIKAFRKIIDGGAFKIYGHWVKRGEEQNRAALFEITPKRDLKNSMSIEKR